MKVLFVSSGNSDNGISILIKNQGESLIKSGIDLTFFVIRGKKITGYLKNVAALRKVLKSDKYDVVHAHYSLSGFVAALSGASPLVVSLMGSDIKSNKYLKFLISFFIRFFWDITIVKSPAMKENLGVKSLIVIPNGVNLSVFKPGDKIEAINRLKWDITKKHIVFGSDPGRKEKNFSLFSEAIKLLDSQSNLKCHTLVDIPYFQIPIYLNAANVLVLSSLWEGSPNIIKEAMACNCPIVTTDVGDVRWVIEETKGCSVSSFEPEELADKLRHTLEYSESNRRTNGHERIIALGLDTQTIAAKMIGLYMKVIPK